LKHDGLSTGTKNHMSFKQVGGTMKRGRGGTASLREKAVFF
jgi:hypothetical protein